jgi:acyl dehydratase
LHAESEVLEVRRSASRPEIGFVKTRTTTYNQDDQPVMVMVANLIIATRDS